MKNKQIVFYILVILSNSFIFANMIPCKDKVEIIKKKAYNGDEIQKFILGLLYKEGICVDKNISKSIKLLVKSEQLGYPPAKYILGDLYYFGEDIKIDSGKAEKYYNKILNEDNLEILTRLGNIFLMHNKKEDLVKAKDMYTLAVKRNFIPALNNLGMMYFFGKGVDRNLTKAIKYLGKSAVRGNKNSQFYLAISLYYNI